MSRHSPSPQELTCRSLIVRHGGTITHPSIGFVSGLLGGALPTDQSQYLPSVLFGLVILVLLIRPAGLFARGTAVERV